MSALIHGLWKFQFEMTFSRVDFDVQAIFSFNSTSCQNKIFAEFFNLNTIRSTEILINNSDDNAKQCKNSTKAATITDVKCVELLKK